MRPHNGKCQETDSLPDKTGGKAKKPSPSAAAIKRPVGASPPRQIKLSVNRGAQLALRTNAGTVEREKGIRRNALIT